MRLVSWTISVGVQPRRGTARSQANSPSVSRFLSTAMTLSVLHTQLRRTTSLVLSTLLVLTGLLGAGCGSARVARDGGSASASASRGGGVAASNEQTENQQAEQSEQDGQAAADPVKVLRLPKVRERLQNAAQDWYGTPYDWGGDSKQGVDCSGFVQHVYEDAFAYGLPRVTETQLQSGPSVARDQIRPGDLVFFRPEGEYNHVGVYLGKGTFAHASSSNGVTKTPLEKDYWDRYYWTARRPLTPSTVPDTLTSELLAYRYPDADSTVAVTEASDAATQKAGETPNADASGGPTLASCEEESVECADPSGASSQASDSGEGETRKGW
jgi:cell wall-associated NlpC family hydrolase